MATILSVFLVLQLMTIWNNIVSTNSDPNRPNDLFIAEFKIESANRGTSYVSGTTFNLKFKLNYTDTYNISVAKHPFSATVTVSGTIDLHRSNLATLPPIPTLTVTQTPTPTPTVPEFSSWTIPMLLTVMALVASLLVYHKETQTHFSQESLTNVFSRVSQETLTRTLLSKTSSKAKYG